MIISHDRYRGYMRMLAISILHMHQAMAMDSLIDDPRMHHDHVNRDNCLLPAAETVAVHRSLSFQMSSCELLVDSCELPYIITTGCYGNDHSWPSAALTCICRLESLEWFKRVNSECVIMKGDDRETVSRHTGRWLWRTRHKKYIEMFIIHPASTKNAVQFTPASSWSIVPS